MVREFKYSKNIQNPKHEKIQKPEHLRYNFVHVSESAP